MWSRRPKGFASYALPNGKRIKFKTADLYSLACSEISKSRYDNILDFIKFVKSLPTGFEISGETVVPMMQPIQLQSLFIPAPVPIAGWDD